MDPLSVVDISLRLGAALGLGALLGLERERKNRPAGFRTMILISLGSGGFVLAGQMAILDAAHSGVAGNAMNGADISRVLQGLMGGVGFLGAGAVIQNKKAVRGLTTAAAVWVTACVGAACGMGLFKLGAVLAAFALFTLIVLEIVENKYFPEPEDAKKEDVKMEDKERVVDG
jgi:putative Mg2+ transporter-C (MgtC) family protein